MLSRYLTVDVNSVLGLLHCVDVGSVAGVSEIRDPEDEGSIYVYVPLKRRQHCLHSCGITNLEWN
jgi:hypothetical protein